MHTTLMVCKYRTGDLLKRLAEKTQVTGDDEQKPSADGEPSSKVAKLGISDDLK
jgi:hypothetical protein